MGYSMGATIFYSSLVSVRLFFLLLFSVLFFSLALATAEAARAQSASVDEIPLDALFGAEDYGESYEEGQDLEGDNDGDPLEGINRVSYGFNRGLDAVLLRPLAKLWNFLFLTPLIKSLATLSLTGLCPSRLLAACWRETGQGQPTQPNDFC